MNLETVGMENLPNIFIRKIFVYPYSETLNEVTIVLNMYDHKFDKSWKGVINDLKAKVCIINNQEEIQKLNDGTMSLIEKKVGEFGVHELSCNQFTENSIEDNDDYLLYSSRITVYLDKSASPMNVYAACFIDDLGFGIDLFDKFYGPMSGEVIMTSEGLNRASGYFYNISTNQEYGGPVHQGNSGYMAGSSHTDQDHPNLRFIEEENFKIIVNDIGEA